VKGVIVNGAQACELIKMLGRTLERKMTE